MKILFSHPIFWLGLAIRLAIILSMTPHPIADWYAPFLSSSVDNWSLNPWGTWLADGGTPSAFPYGYAMWGVFLPVTVLAKLFSVPVIYAYAATLVLIDIAMLSQLRMLLPGKDKLLLCVYWLSPIIIAASYFFGYNDLVPVFFLIISFNKIKQHDFFRAGLFCAIAVSAKLSMVIALPFFIIYFVNNRKLSQFLPPYLKGFSVGASVLLFTFAFASSSGMAMLIGNPEIRKVYQLALPFDNGSKLYVVPLVYLLMVYAAWRVRRLNFDLFNAVLGLAFLLVVVLTPLSPGWFVWAIPLLVCYQMLSDRLAVFLVSIFSTIYILLSLTTNEAALALLARAGLQVESISLSADSAVFSGLQTGLVAVGIILGCRIWRESITKNDFFRLSRKPFVIGVAGDSGAGKDTFSEAIRDLFGPHSVAALSGDDYHLWDRQKPMWQVMTHLNPMANDLDSFGQDVKSLSAGKSIHSRHYDHSTGKMSKPSVIRSNDIIIASGLHALYSSAVRECYDLKIYLDIDESLRRFFKIQRDVTQRGHSLDTVLSSFEKREGDSQKFIRPQSASADLIFSVQPIHPRILEESTKHPLRFKLEVRSRNGYDTVSLMRTLIGVCGLHLDVLYSDNNSETVLTIEGESKAEDIELAAKVICPSVFEFLDVAPKWQDGVLGLMQLFTLSHINQELKKRSV